MFSELTHVDLSLFLVSSLDIMMIWELCFIIFLIYLLFDYFIHMIRVVCVWWAYMGLLVFFRFYLLIFFSILFFYIGFIRNWVLYYFFTFFSWGYPILTTRVASWHANSSCFLILESSLLKNHYVILIDYLISC